MRKFDYMRFPVQYVLRPNQEFRGFAGQVASGSVRPGDPVMVLPSGRTSRVKSITTYDGDLSQAFAPMSVTLCLEDEIDVSRGDMLVPPQHPPHVARRFEATMVWMNHKPLEPGKPYLVKHTTQQVGGTVTSVRYRVDVNTLELGYQLGDTTVVYPATGTVNVNGTASLLVNSGLRLARQTSPPPSNGAKPSGTLNLNGGGTTHPGRTAAGDISCYYTKPIKLKNKKDLTWALVNSAGFLFNH